MQPKRVGFLSIMEDAKQLEMEESDALEDKPKLPETGEKSEENQAEFRSRKRPLLYECPKVIHLYCYSCRFLHFFWLFQNIIIFLCGVCFEFDSCEEDWELLRKIKKINRDVDVALTRRRLFIGQELRNPSEVSHR